MIGLTYVRIFWLELYIMLYIRRVQDSRQSNIKSFKSTIADKCDNIKLRSSVAACQLQVGTRNYFSKDNWTRFSSFHKSKKDFHFQVIVDLSTLIKIKPLS